MHVVSGEGEERKVRQDEKYVWAEEGGKVLKMY